MRHERPGSRFLRPAVGLILAAACGRPPAFVPPGIESWTGEPQVAAKIERARDQASAAPDSAAVVGGLGKIFHAHELHAEAVACYRRAMELAPAEPRWPYLAALTIAETDLEGSVDDFERAAARGAGQPAVHVSFGDVLTRLGRSDGAAEQYRRALELAPGNSHALYGLAQSALAGGDVETAAEHLEQAAGSSPHHGEVHALLARAYQRLGREEEAERALLRASAFSESGRIADPFLAEVEAEAVNSRAFTDRGRRLAEDGRFGEAEAEFRKVFEIRPGNARDFSNLGGALAGQGRLEEAMAEYRKSLEIDPDDTYTLNNLAMTLARRGDLDAATRHLERAIAVDPAYTDALRNLGLLRARQGRHREAIGHYRRALEVSPGLFGVHNDLGTSLAALGELEQAMDHWRRTADIAPWELSAVYNLAIAHAQRGEHAEAVGWLRQGLATAPDSSRLVSLLAWELATAPDAELRDGAEAERLARRVWEAYPDRPQMGDGLAAALAAQGRFADAIGVAEKALAQARAAGAAGLAEQIALRLELYRQGRPFDQSLAPAGTGRQPR